MSVLLGDRNLRTYPPSTQRAFRISRRTTRPRPCTACGHDELFPADKLRIKGLPLPPHTLVLDLGLACAWFA